jgi:hypothetical protein
VFHVLSERAFTAEGAERAEKIEKKRVLPTYPVFLSAFSAFSSENKRIQKFRSVNMALIFIPLVCRASGMISSAVNGFSQTGARVVTLENGDHPLARP